MEVKGNIYSKSVRKKKGVLLVMRIDKMGWFTGRDNVITVDPPLDGGQISNTIV